MRGLRRLLVVAVLIAVAVAAWVIIPWSVSADLDADRSFTVPQGASMTTVADKLEAEGIIGSASGFLLRAKLLGGSTPIQAGEFALEQGMSPADILTALQSGKVVRRFVTVPEGMPSVLVRDLLLREPLLTGDVPVPAEGSVLPETYSFERGETRAAVLGRMQAAMAKTLQELWPERRPHAVVRTPQEALTLAAIVEKETGVPRERRMVAGLYSNRLRQGIRLQADPTIIYPITRGRPLGRRILRSEIDAVNGYNTYSRDGLPTGPITNPGRLSIAAVLNPEQTNALYMVADGSGGHVFAATLAEHNANVAKWRAYRREKGI